MDREIMPKPQKPRVVWSGKHGMWMVPPGNTYGIAAAPMDRMRMTQNLVTFVIRLNTINGAYCHA